MTEPRSANVRSHPISEDFAHGGRTTDGRLFRALSTPGAGRGGAKKLPADRLRAMIKPGLVSISFRQLSPSEIINLIRCAGLLGIEWGGDVHVPHGDTSAASGVLQAGRAAALEVAAYGSYYRVGHSEDEGLSFNHVLHTAIELEAPTIRVWAGKKNSEDASPEYSRLIENELRHICEKAAQSNIQIATEFHGGTLCNTSSSTRQLIEAVGHPNLKTLWQPVTASSTSQNAESLRELLPHLSHLHVFHWDESGKRPLSEGEMAWREYFSLAENHAKWALLEFVENDDPQNFLRDAATLKSWIE